MKRYGPAPVKHPLRQLAPVPIELRYVEKVRALLEAHGASFVETTRAGMHTFKEFTITFPPGTTRVYEVTLSRTCSFTIFLPDGYEQPAAELWPLVCGPGERPTTVLYLPAEEEEPHVALS